MSVSGENTIVERDASELEIPVDQVAVEKDKSKPRVTVVELATSEFHHKQIIID